MIEIYNSLTQQKKAFKSIEPQKASIYYCGMTVYDYCHIGHARGWVVFEAFKRFLQSQGYDVTMVRNITDIDDKIIKRANENGQSPADWAQRFIDAMHEDEQGLGLTPVDHEPRATEYLQQMIDLIADLIEKNIAYQADNGDVCFSVRAYPKYGALSKRDIDDLKTGVRKDVDVGKRDPLDFVLWKKAKPDEPSWSSPWGEGRPGWHIECSAMASSLLGTPFDIHGGGLDLKFPHHENEIAQSQAACDHDFANYWMHIGLVQVGSEKMSKSLGNFVTIRDLLKKYDAEILRFFLMSAHYRSPLTFTEEQVEQSHIGLKRLYQSIEGFDLIEITEWDADQKSFQDRFIQALSDDFNTPLAFSVLFDLARQVNRLRDERKLDAATQYASLLIGCANVLGLLNQNPAEFLQQGEENLDVEAIERLVVQRREARDQKDWALADQLRDQLLAMGIVCEDKADGRGWRVDNSAK
jgi:cysteinyl-tRNA synthetase